MDANGKVWATNRYADNAVRIDPNGDTDNLGAVDLTVSLGTGAGPYNYSDMTGAASLGATSWLGHWSIMQQGWNTGTTWGKVSWSFSEPAGTEMKVEARIAGSVT